MTTKCTFICGLHNIEVKENLGEGVTLILNEENGELPIIKLTNNRKKIQSVLSKNLAILIGVIEYNHLVERYPIVAYAESDFEWNDGASIRHLDLHHFLLKMYFFCLWLVKDHAADFDIGFLQFLNANNVFEVSSNNMSNSYFDTCGNRALVLFTIDELNKACEYFKNSIYMGRISGPMVANASPLGKVSIANYFIQGAMSDFDLGLKAVGYCSALESLFSNGDNTELSHKLSERISKFLENDLKERKLLYKTVKKIYEIRSKVVHGATYKSHKVEELADLIKRADNICRRVMIYAFITPSENNIFDKSKEDLEEYFIDLILS